MDVLLMAGLRLPRSIWAEVGAEPEHLGGDVPELSRVKDVVFGDVDSGHWPMVTRPAESAPILDSAAGGG
jgi:hypothetical protein